MITYAGVPLSVASPELAAHVERTVSPRDVYQFERLLWPGRNRTGWTFPGQLADRSIRIGSLYWPRSASRWAVGHFLATDAQLVQIRGQVYAGSAGYQSRPLTLTWEGPTGTVATVTADLWLLPARPLFQPQDGRGLWLLTLVDDRYFWWQRSTGDLSVADNTTPWADLFAAVAAQLGTTVSYDMVASAYLKPSGSLTSRFECLPLFLDAVAYNVGHRVCRRLDGSVRSESYATSRSTQDANLQAVYPVTAGGKLALTPGQPNDLLSLLPGTVRLTFPRVDDGEMTSNDVYEQAVTLADLALADLPGVAGNGGVKTFHDTALAQYTSGVLGNGAELLALAQQTATDWYRWQLGGLDLVLAGVVPWVPSGLDDSVEWTYRQGEVSTRVQRSAWDDLTEELLHAGSVGSYPDGSPPPPPGSATPDLTVEYDDATGGIGMVDHLRFPKASTTLTSPASHVAAWAPIWGPDIQSVGSANVAGTSEKFAREDHVHAGLGTTIIENITITINPTYNLTFTGDTLVFDATTVNVTSGTWTWDTDTILYFGGNNYFTGALYVQGQMHWDNASYTLSGTQDEWDPASHKAVYQIVPTSNVFLTGMKPAEPGKVRVIMHDGTANKLILAHDDAGSAAQYRFFLPDQENLALGPGDCAIVWYDALVEAWLLLTMDSVFGPTGGGSYSRGMVPSVNTALDGDHYVAADGKWVKIDGDPTSPLAVTVTRTHAPEKLLISVADSGSTPDDKFVGADGSDTSPSYLIDKIEPGGILTASVITVLGQRKVLLGVNGGYTSDVDLTSIGQGTLHFIDGRLDSITF